MTETFVCSCCGQEYPICDCYEVENCTFCPDCLDEETLVCTHCEERILNHQNLGDDDSPLCQHCFENHYLMRYAASPGRCTLFNLRERGTVLL